MKEVPLTRGKIALVDDEDYAVVIQHKWFANPSRNTYYAVTYAYPNGKQTKLQMHNLVMRGGLFVDDGMTVDHINGSGLDNRRSNLRFASKSIQKQNGRVYCNNSTGYKGVYPFQGRFGVAIKKDKRKYFLGYFDTPEDAAQAYDRKAVELYGPHAAINFER